ncbi:hypothetical protein [Streptococcus ruminantium]|uniref:hypothetical protein n=1 Tax=Streptococcus ruminantium TaxID=1917441 RepID=UPI001D136FEF|nr:hypothetical protein [Streptococcus ruminantium]
MKIKQVLASLFLVIGMMSLLGGCSMTKETLTKEQQDNVVKRIAKDYNIQSISFTDFYRDEKTGTYLLSIRLNDSPELETTIPIRTLERLSNTTDSIGLNPIDDFEVIKRENTKLNPIVSEIKVTYLEE